jgi:hypothetical protein
MGSNESKAIEKMTSQDEIMKYKIHGGNKQDNQVPEEYASDPDLYWAI